VKEQTYIEAMRALGASPVRIIWLHIVPNILSPVIVQASFIFARTIVTEAALSFLGWALPFPRRAGATFCTKAKRPSTKPGG
jgi:peptide/nickel transport system permease protein